MTSITIRKLDDAIKARLRVRAARHGRSMEEEAREILKSGLAEEPARIPNLAQAIRRHVEPLGGVKLKLPACADPEAPRFQPMIVLDTNVLSEAFRPSPAEAVLDWLAGQEPLTVFTTSITVAEILYAVEALPSRKRRSRLAAAVDKVFAEEFQGRILSFDEEAARTYSRIVAGRDAAGRPISREDAMIAAIVRSRRAALATRNTSDFEGCGLRLINPWVE